MAEIEACTQLTEPIIEQLRRAQSSVAEADGHSPLNEAALLELRPDSTARHALLREADRLIGYAQFDGRDAQLFVIPSQRDQGFGTQLTQFVDAHWRPAGWWSFGTLPAAQRLASSMGLVAVRELAKMERELAEPPAEPELPAGYEISSYQPAELPELVKVNARAFADHPEQGQMTVEDAQRRMAQDWFDARDLLMLKAPDGQLAGFHWTKLEAGLGEVYVLAVDPDFAGQGLGRSLLHAGLRQLSSRGAGRVELYVEKENEPVVRLYERAGFEITNIDTNFAPARRADDRQIARPS